MSYIQNLVMVVLTSLLCNLDGPELYLLKAKYDLDMEDSNTLCTLYLSLCAIFIYILACQITKDKLKIVQRSERHVQEKCS